MTNVDIIDFIYNQTCLNLKCKQMYNHYDVNKILRWLFLFGQLHNLKIKIQFRQTIKLFKFNIYKKNTC